MEAPPQGKIPTYRISLAHQGGDSELLEIVQFQLFGRCGRQIRMVVKDDLDV
jgi:hypothetical protein